MFKTFCMHFFTPEITTFAAVACVNFPLVKQSTSLLVTKICQNKSLTSTSINKKSRLTSSMMWSFNKKQV